MLREMYISWARSPFLRRAASRAYRLPMVGGALRNVTEYLVPSQERTWIQIPSGLGKGLWLKVLPKWEPGYLAGCPEEGMNQVLAEHLRPGDCFYDVGAHIGFYSLIAARVTGQGGRVITFEPDPENAETIQENAARNRFAHVEVFCKAVSDSDGTVRFYQPVHDDFSRMSGMMIVEDLPGIRPSEVHPCPAVSLDTFCSAHREPDLLKIDVEGAEVQVLEGAKRLLARKKPTLIIEVHDQNTVPEVRSMLSGLGYKFQPLLANAGTLSDRHFVASALRSMTVRP